MPDELTYAEIAKQITALIEDRISSIARRRKFPNEAAFMKSAKKAMHAAMLETDVEGLHVDVTLKPLPNRSIRVRVHVHDKPEKPHDKAC